jgi:hypothetical protein
VLTNLLTSKETEFGRQSLMKLGSKYVVALGVVLIFVAVLTMGSPLATVIVDTEPPVIILPPSDNESSLSRYASNKSEIEFKVKLYDRATRPIWTKIRLEQQDVIFLDWTEMKTDTMESTGLELTNPDFEAGDLTGWIDVRSNGITAEHVQSEQYAVVSEYISGDQSGEFMVLYQDVFVSDFSDSIDNGESTVDVVGWVANRFNSHNWCKIQIVFLNSANAEISSTDTGWLFSGDRWTFVKAEKTNQPVPKTTRYIRYCWWIKNDKGYDTEGYLDNAALNLKIAGEEANKVKEGEEAYILFDYCHLYSVPDDFPVDEVITTKIKSSDEAGNIAEVQWRFILSGPEGKFFFNNQEVDKDIIVFLETRELDLKYIQSYGDEIITNCMIKISSIDGKDLSEITMKEQDNRTYTGSYTLLSNGTWRISGWINIEAQRYNEMDIIVTTDIGEIKLERTRLISILLSLGTLFIGASLLVKGLKKNQKR